VPFTLRNLKEDLEDIGSVFDGAPDLEFRAATKPLELEESALSYQRVGFLGLFILIFLMQTPFLGWWLSPAVFGYRVLETISWHSSHLLPHMPAPWGPWYVSNLQPTTFREDGVTPAFPVGFSQRDPVLAFLQHPVMLRLMMPQLVFIDREQVIRAQYAGDHAIFEGIAWVSHKPRIPLLLINSRPKIHTNRSLTLYHLVIQPRR